MLMENVNYDPPSADEAVGEMHLHMGTVFWYIIYRRLRTASAYVVLERDVHPTVMAVRCFTPPGRIPASWCHSSTVS